ncbi:MAG: dihydrofolate reductase [Pseudomonadales bacterium]|nr:dihydrofolate reductase [Pseudomonadales bacterium]
MGTQKTAASEPEIPVSLIWAMTTNRVIGRDNGLPWQLKTDMQFFIDSTRGKPVIMGRKQFDSMPKALPRRLNIVITRNSRLKRAGATIVPDLQKAIAVARRSLVGTSVEQCEIMVIGGAEIYALALPIADRLYMTEIDAVLEGDTYFPEFHLGDWSESSSKNYLRDDKNEYNFRIRRLDRVSKKTQFLSAQDASSSNE